MLDCVLEASDRHDFDVFGNFPSRLRVPLRREEDIGIACLRAGHFLFDSSYGPHSAVAPDLPGPRDSVPGSEVLGSQAIVKSEREHETRGRACDPPSLELKLDGFEIVRAHFNADERSSR